MQEAGITFDLRFRRTHAPPEPTVRAINAWRQVLHLAGLIGRQPGSTGRLGGIGYGNISLRLGTADGSPDQRRFLISGARTGCLSSLRERHYTTVLECRPERNLVVAEGPIRPSSESLTHGTLYALDPGVGAVMHAHSPDIWRWAAELGMPITAKSAAYGSPEMAAEVERLFRSGGLQPRPIFAMGGHRDGVVSFGGSLEEAGCVLLGALARAFELGAGERGSGRLGSPG